jgi:hypothetical protein
VDLPIARRLQLAERGGLTGAGGIVVVGVGGGVEGFEGVPDPPPHAERATITEKARARWIEDRRGIMRALRYPRKLWDG